MKETVRKEKKKKLMIELSRKQSWEEGKEK
jgi:hypothetical protein